MDRKNVLLAFAMKEEAADAFQDYNCIFTGVGKVNATHALMKGIAQFQPEMIINLGTAGSTTFNRGTVVCCTNFIQRDMEVSALGFEKFQTPFESIPIVLNNGIEVENLPQGTCGSGDQFEMEHTNSEYQVIEMEAYALAKVALIENIPFLCLKYISDGADGNAVDDWNLEIKKASIALRNALEAI